MTSGALHHVALIRTVVWESVLRPYKFLYCCILVRFRNEMLNALLPSRDRRMFVYIDVA
jgi:hypothetical protein